MKYVEPSQFADPDVAARKLVEIANEIGRASKCKKRLDCGPTATTFLFHRWEQNSLLGTQVQVCKNLRSWG
jgi:hypothetical protein